MNELSGIKESDTGLAHPALWDLAADKQVTLNDVKNASTTGLARVWVKSQFLRFLGKSK